MLPRPGCLEGHGQTPAPPRTPSSPDSDADTQAREPWVPCPGNRKRGWANAATALCNCHLNLSAMTSPPDCHQNGTAGLVSAPGITFKRSQRGMSRFPSLAQRGPSPSVSPRASHVLPAVRAGLQSGGPGGAPAGLRRDLHGLQRAVGSASAWVWASRAPSGVCDLELEFSVSFITSWGNLFPALAESSHLS